ncbi:MAG: GTPase, partial [Dehalococcoidia bacterium]
MRIGIIGLPDSGKTTTFNALTRGRVPTGAGGRRGANVGVAQVPDGRLAVLSEMHNRSPLVPAEVTYVDLPEAADARGGPFAGEAVTHLQRVDALLAVVRAFDNPSVPHPKETVDYRRDITDIA